jgi:hypothetical protein
MHIIHGKRIQIWLQWKEINESDKFGKKHDSEITATDERSEHQTIGETGDRMRDTGRFTRSKAISLAWNHRIAN